MIAFSEILDLREFPSEILLRRAYSEVYAPNFCSVPNEFETVDQYVQRICTDRNNESPETHFLVSMIGSEIAGIAVSECYLKSKCCLLTYIAVSKSARGMGISSALMSRTKEIAKNSECDIVLSESHNPNLVDSSTESIDPWVRLKILESLGFGVVPVEYVQPPLIPGGAESSKLLLMSLSGELPRHRIVKFYEEFYRTLTGSDPALSENLLKMKISRLSARQIQIFGVRVCDLLD